MPREVFDQHGKLLTFEEVTEDLKQDFYKRYRHIAASDEAEEVARQYVAQNHPMLDADTADDYRNVSKYPASVRTMTRTAFTPTPDDLSYPEMLKQVGKQIKQAIEEVGGTDNLIRGLDMQAGRQVTDAAEQKGAVIQLRNIAKKHRMSLEQAVLEEDGLKRLIFKELGLE